MSDRLDREKRLSLDLTSIIVTQTAKALSKAHKLGIVHRDIKPDNLFLTYEDDELFLKVLDFGIAKQTGVAAAKSVTSTGMMVGTPEYMSPEQVLSAKTVSSSADVWALAVVSYHCLTGGVPFTGETLGLAVRGDRQQGRQTPFAAAPGPAAGARWLVRTRARQGRATALRDGQGGRRDVQLGVDRHAAAVRRVGVVSGRPTGRARTQPCRPAPRPPSPIRWATARRDSLDPAPFRSRAPPQHRAVEARRRSPGRRRAANAPPDATKRCSVCSRPRWSAQARRRSCCSAATSPSQTSPSPTWAAQPWGARP